MYIFTSRLKSLDQFYSPIAIKLTGAAVGLYRYNLVVPYSANILIPTLDPEPGQLLIFLTQDPQNQFSLVAVMKGTSTNGGSAKIVIDTKNVGSPRIIAQDDPAFPSNIAGDFADIM
jgi:hypothetical protein